MTEHTDVGAYALGLLDPADRRAFEAHLTTCPSCRAELASLAEVAVTLSGVDRIEPEPAATDPGSDLTGLLRRRARKARAQRRSRVLLSAAAGLALLGGGIAAGSALAPSSSPAHTKVIDLSAQQLLTSQQPHSATDPSTGVQGTVAMQQTGWGAKVALRIGVVKGPLTCQLVAIAKAGGERVVTGWAVPATGYGLPGSPPPLVVAGGTDLRPGDIDHFEVRTSDGRTLVSIPS